MSNAKDKLLKLMSVSHPRVDGEMDSSDPNLNSCSTQTTVVHPDGPATPPAPESEVLVSALPVPASPPPYVPPPPMPPSALALASSNHDHSSSSLPPPLLQPQPCPFSPPPADGSSYSSHSNQRRAELAPERLSLRRCSEETQSKPAATLNSGSEVTRVEEALVASPTTQPNHVHGSTLLSPTWSGPAQADSMGPTGDTIVSPPATGGGWPGFISNEQLQEILQDLSMDARDTSAFRSPDRTRSPSTNQIQDELSPLSPRSPCSRFYFRYPSISPYTMRKRRPPFYPHRPSPHHTGFTPPRRSKETGLHKQDESQGTGDPIKNDSSLVLCSEDGNKGRGEVDEGEERAVGASPRRRRRERRWARRGPPPPRRCSVTPYSGQSHRHAPPDPEGGKSRNQEAELGVDPYGYSDSDSDSSSEDYCYYHRPYCESCLQGPYESSDSTSETSDSEYGGVFDHTTHPVVNFNEDLKPTFV